jgi:hypothetical protein
MDACIVLGVASLAIVLLLGSTAFAQTSPAPTDVVATINAANKFQQVLAASGTARRMLRIGNNNTNDDICWVFVGSGRASKEGSYPIPIALHREKWGISESESRVLESKFPIGSLFRQKSSSRQRPKSFFNSIDPKRTSVMINFVHSA